MKLFRKSFKKFPWGFLIFIVLIIAFLAVWFDIKANVNFTIIAPSRASAYTKDELADAYWRNREAFTNVAEIVLANERIRQIIINNYDDDFDIYTKNDKRFFTEPEWKQIEELFLEIKPTMLMLSLRNNDRVVYFNFPDTHVNGKVTGTSLFYFKNSATMERYKGYVWVGTLEHLDGYWYIEEDHWNYPGR